MRYLTIPAYAKINWRLAVTSRRPDGYHDLHGLMQSISLCDSFCLYESEQDECVVYPAVPGLVQEDNLAYRAWQMLKKQMGLQKACRIEIEKHIPVGGGLAGGSANAAAVLQGANTLFDLGLSLEELQALGFQLGADVPFCLQGGLALARGVGEQLTRLPEPPPLYLLIAHGGVTVSTGRVFAEYRLSKQPVSSLAEEERLARELAGALAVGNMPLIENLLGNDLADSAERLYPQICEVKALLRTAGLRPLLSGSGGCYFALCADREAAEAAHTKLAKHVAWLTIAQTQGGALK